MSSSTVPAEPIHLQPDDYHVLGEEVFRAPGLTARESVGPFVDVTACGALVTVHDSHFGPRAGVGHHPHRHNERLFYILDGEIEHDDQRNDIQGTMHAGDLGILTEGRHGMVHSERNDGDQPARVYVLVHPCDPMPATASFDAVRASEMPRSTRADGVELTTVLARDDERIHGDTREIGDARLEVGASQAVRLDAGEGGLVFCLDGRVQVDVDGAEPVTNVGIDDTVLLPPAEAAREVRITSQAPSRVLHVVAGRGEGLRLADR